MVIGSKNPDKAKEMEEILAASGIEAIRDANWPDVEESGATLEENAILKARAVAGATGLPALADDTGLEVEALDGQPGVHTARFAGPDATYEENVAALLDALEGVEDRRARFRTVVALVDEEGDVLLGEGRLEGRISEEPRGTYGFGYDPVFEVEGRTLGQLSSAEKHAISHRAKALRALASRLQ